MNKSQNFQNQQNFFMRYGGAQPGRRWKAGRLAAFPLLLEVL